MKYLKTNNKFNKLMEEEKLRNYKTNIVNTINKINLKARSQNIYYHLKILHISTKICLF